MTNDSLTEAQRKVIGEPLARSVPRDWVYALVLVPGGGPTSNAAVISNVSPSESLGRALMQIGRQMIDGAHNDVITLEIPDA